MANNYQLPQLTFLSPEELLQNAENHFNCEELFHMKAVVLEAWAAFEMYVDIYVYAALERKMDKRFFKWIKEKSRFRVEDRVKVLLPIALGSEIDTSSKLYNHFTKSKNLRNDVVHKGIRVTREEAKEVKDFAYEWLSFLSSRIEIQNALYKLQDFLLTNPFPPDFSEAYAINQLTGYFMQNGDIVTPLQQFENVSSYRPDVFLKFGSNNVVIEIKRLANGDIDKIISKLRNQLKKEMDGFKADVGVFIVLTKDSIGRLYRNVQEFNEGSIYMLIIPIR